MDVRWGKACMWLFSGGVGERASEWLVEFNSGMFLIQRGSSESQVRRES